MRHWPLPSDSACMFFPRLLGYDKLRGRFEAFAPSGAIAGTLSRASEHWPVWTSACGEDAIVRPGLRPACAVDDEQRGRLAAVGVNTVQTVRRPGREGPKACTLAGPGAIAADWRSLSAKRLALLVVNSIERGTRWMVFEPNEPAAWRRATQQLHEFMTALEERGAFAEREPGDRWFVVCDERVNRERHREQGIVNLMFGIPAQRPGGFHAWLVSHRAGGSRVQTVSPNLVGVPDTGLTQVLAELDLVARRSLAESAAARRLDHQFIARLDALGDACRQHERLAILSQQAVDAGRARGAAGEAEGRDAPMVRQHRDRHRRAEPDGAHESVAAAVALRPRPNRGGSGTRARARGGGSRALRDR